MILLQAVASSLEGAKHLVKLCQNSEDTTKVNQGILIGSGRPYHLSNTERDDIKEYFSDLEQCDIGEVAERYRSAFLRMHQIAVGGKLYRSGDIIIAKQQNTDVCLRISDILLVTVNDDPEHLIFGDTYQIVTNDFGDTIHHPFSDTICVKPFESGRCFGLQDIQREIMLFPEENGNYSVIDPLRQRIPLPPVIVPVYPEVNDMVLIKGLNDEIWYAQVKHVLFAQQIVKGYFYMKHPNWDINKTWVRESHSNQMDSINFGSVLNIASGEWHGNAWKEL